MDYEPIEKISDINGDIISDLWPDVLFDVLENIGDENTPATAVREVIIKISFRPTKERDSAETTVEMKTKLSPPKPNSSLILLSNDGNKTTAYSRHHEPDQKDLGFDRGVVKFQNTEVK